MYFKKIKCAIAMYHEREQMRSFLNFDAGDKIEGNFRLSLRSVGGSKTYFS